MSKQLSPQYRNYINSDQWRKGWRRGLTMQLLLGRDAICPLLKAHHADHLHYKNLTRELPLRDLVPLIDTPRSKETGILGSSRPLKLDTLQCLAQRWDSPQALIWVCPTLFALLRVLFKFETNSFQNTVRLAPLNLLPTARWRLEQCSRTA
jgi:hypothetical protein